jgi:transcriptional regulator with XRE-family HTH domain
MASVVPHGEKLRHLRRALGWTQLELALRAGVSERTVRSAERGRPVRRDFLDYLAGALGVDLQELAREPAILDGLLRWRRNAETLIQNLVRYQYGRDAGPFLELLHSNFRLEIRADQGIYAAGMAREIQGEFVGASGFQRSVDNSLEFDSRPIERSLIFHTPVGDDNLIVLRAFEAITYINGYQESLWTVQAFEFDDQRIVRVHNNSGCLRPGGSFDGIARNLSRSNFVPIPTASGSRRQADFSSRTWKYRDAPRRFSDRHSR